MNWFNYYGLIIFGILMIPNLIEAKKHPESFENHFNSRMLETLEQTGRIGSFLFMVFNIPYLCSGFWMEDGKNVYIIANAILLLSYLLVWIVIKDRFSTLRAVLLSVIPSVIFVFSGIMLLSYPLIAFSILFAVCHIIISVKNVKFQK